MFASNQELRSTQGHLLALLVAVLIACMGCASTPAAPTDMGPAQLSSVQVGVEGDTTVVSLEGLEAPVYNAFQQEDPARVILDIASVTPGEVAPAIAVYDGTVDEVTVTGFENAGAHSTRIELALATVAAYEVVDNEGRVEIRVSATDVAGHDG